MLSTITLLVGISLHEHSSKLESGDATFFFREKEGYKELVGQTETINYRRTNTHNQVCLAKQDSCRNYMIEYLKKNKASDIKIFSEKISGGVRTRTKYALVFEYKIGDLEEKVVLKSLNQSQSELEMIAESLLKSLK